METGALASAISWLIESSVPARSAKLDAFPEIDAFRGRTSTSPWKLGRADVADRLKDLVKDARLVQQGALGLCGPAAFLRSWISDDPVAFVKFAAALFENGKAGLGSKIIEPSSDLVGQDYAVNVKKVIETTSPKRPDLVCPTADWMVMCSLIDSANLVSDYEGTPDDAWSAGSFISQAAGWFEAVGYTTDSWSNIANPDFIYQLTPSPPRRHVVLRVDAGLVGNPRNGTLESMRAAVGAPRVADHFIVLESAVMKDLRDGKIRMQGWTWGESETYPLTDEDIRQNVWDVLTAER